MNTKNLVIAAAVALFSTACPLQSGVPGDSPDITFPGGSVAPGGEVTLSSGSMTLSAAVANAEPGTTPTWTSSNTAVATVTANGLTATITAVANGTAIITFAQGTKSAHFTVTVSIVVPPASLAITGTDSLALGDTQTFTVAAKDAQGNAVSAKATSWSGDSDLFQITATTQGDGTSVTVKAIGAGAGRINATLGGVSAPAKSVHATAVSVAVAPKTATLTAGTAQALTATSKGTGSITGTATRTAWTVTQGCTLTPSSGASTSVNRSTAGTCTVTATLDGLTDTAVITYTAPQVPASIAVTGADTLDVHAAASTYTAVVKDAQGNAISGATVGWSPDASITVSGTGNTVTVVGQKVGAATLTVTFDGLQSVVRTIAINPVSLDVSPATVSVLTSPGAAQPVIGRAVLRAKDAAGNVVPFARGLTFASGALTETHAPKDSNFNFFETSLNQDGTIQLQFYDLTAAPATHTATLNAFGKSAALAVNTIGADSVSIALKPGAAVPFSSSASITPNVLAGAVAQSGVAVALSTSGDSVFGQLEGSVTTPETLSGFVAHLGKTTLTATALGKTASVDVYGVPVSVTSNVASPIALQAGGPVVNVAFTLRGLNGAAIALDNEEAVNGAGHWGTLGVVSLSGGVAGVNACGRAGANWACTVSPTAAGSTSVRVTWTSPDGAQQAGPFDFPVTVSAPPAPVLAPGVYTATWTGPKTYALSFPAADASGGGTLTYKVYESSVANVDDATLYGGAGQDLTVSGSGPVTATFTAGTVSSRRTIGLKAKTTNSALSSGQRFTIATGAASGLPAGVPFIAGRTVYEARTNGSGALVPLYVVVPDGLGGALPEHSAPRAGAFGLSGILINASGHQQLYARPLSTTSFLQSSGNEVVETDPSGACAGTSVRPISAFETSLNGAGTRFFSYTPDFVDCGSVLGVYLSGASGKLANNRILNGFAALGPSSAVGYDGSTLRRIDLAGAAPAEQSSGFVYLGGGPIAGSPSASLTVLSLDATDGLIARSFDTSQIAALASPNALAAAGFSGTPRGLVAASDTLVVAETSSPAGSALWLIDASTPGSPIVTQLATQATFDGDLPTLGVTTSSGN